MKKKVETSIAESMKVEVTFPQCVKIELVQSNDLKHYEIFLWLISLSASVASGFWVSFATLPFNKILFVVSLSFSLFVLVFGLTAYYYRSKIKDIKLTKTLLVDNFDNK